MIRAVPFTELLSAIVDNRGRTCPTAENGIPLIATNCVKNDSLYPTYEKVRYVDDETYSTWFRGHPEPGDILFVCKGSPGSVAMVPDPVDFCIAQDMVSVRTDPDRIYPPYLFATLRSRQVQHQIETMHVGTLIPHFKKGDFHQLQIPVPSVESQRFIGDLYLELSEKVESNRRAVTLLSRLAQGLMGGSSRVRVGDVARLDKGLSYKGSGLVERGGQALVNLANFNSSGWLNRAALKHYVGDHQDRHVVHGGGLVLANTDLTQQRAILGRPALVPSDINACLFTHHVFAVRFTDRPELTVPLWAGLNTAGFRERAEGFATGTTVAGLPKETVLEFEFSVPDDAGAIGEARDLIERAWSAERESESLVALRDALLPELLSGRLRVPEAEELVSDVV